MNETVEIEVKTNDKPYTFRRLNSTDIFAMSKLVSKIGIRDFGKAFEGSGIANLVSLIENKSEDDKEAVPEKALETLGINAVLNIADIIFDKLYKCKNEIYTLLSRVSGLSVTEIQNFEPAVFAEMIIDFCKKEELTDFISAVSKLTK